MSTLLIAIIILLYSFQTLFCKLYSDSYGSRSELATPVFCVLESIAIALISLAFNGFKFNVSAPTLIIGIVNAAMLFGYNTSLIAAGKRGSYAFLNVMMLFGGILMPMLYSAVFLHEQLSILKYATIALMLLACVLMNFDSLKPGKVHISYYIFCLLLFIFNGVYSILIKHQEQVVPSESKEMIIITYAIMGIIALIQLAAKEKGNTLKAFKINGKALLFLILCLVSAGLAVNVLIMLIPLVNISVFYTVEMGGVLTVAAIYAIVIFKEKPSVTKICGIVLAVISITVLSI